MRTALRMSRMPSYTRRDASINSFSSTGWEGLALRASTADSTCSVNRGMTARDKRHKERKKRETSILINTHMKKPWGKLGPSERRINGKKTAQQTHCIEINVKSVHEKNHKGWRWPRPVNLYKLDECDRWKCLFYNGSEYNSRKNTQVSLRRISQASVTCVRGKTAAWMFSFLKLSFHSILTDGFLYCWPTYTLHCLSK